MRFVLALMLVLAAVPLQAQRRTPRLELGAELSHWTLGFGSSFNAPPENGGTSVRAGLLFPGKPIISVGVNASYAAEDSMTPGVTALALELSSRVFRVRPGDPNVFLQLGAGALHVASDERQAVIDRCTPELGCMWEGASVPDTGWYPMLSLGVGIDLPFASSFAVQPTAAVVKIMGEQSEGDPGAFMRLGIGFVIRP
ncbi:MAG TPA: hypothetical protein VFQ45_23730 [Longimicrobium sp.]|nr:hypothetical protein [Longimicrobium sp.]